MKTVVIYTREADRKLEKLDNAIVKQLVRSINKKAESADPLSGAKALRGEMSGRFSYRIGDYRVIFTINKNGEITILTILDVGHRRYIYRSR